MLMDMNDRSKALDMELHEDFVRMDQDMETTDTDLVEGKKLELTPFERYILRERTSHFGMFQ